MVVVSASVGGFRGLGHGVGGFARAVRGRGDDLIPASPRFRCSRKMRSTSGQRKRGRAGAGKPFIPFAHTHLSYLVMKTAASRAYYSPAAGNGWFLLFSLSYFRQKNTGLRKKA